MGSLRRRVDAVARTLAARARDRTPAGSYTPEERARGLLALYRLGESRGAKVSGIIAELQGALDAGDPAQLAAVLDAHSRAIGAVIETMTGEAER